MLTLVPTPDALSLECFPQTVNWVFVKGAHDFAGWRACCWLIIHPCQGLITVRVKQGFRWYKN